MARLRSRRCQLKSPVTGGAWGEHEGCENLLPANVALQEYSLYQVVGLSDLDALVPDQLRATVRLGITHEFRIAWYPLGHSLGQILYSLPLAPGESVNLAVIDWTRRDDAQRKEHATLDEQIVHDEHRDRSITETVDASLKEYQHGSSFMGGVASAAGGSFSYGPYGAAAGIAGALGGSTASSSGSRDLAASTVQKISDNISQVSSGMRELQSTVVVHSTQAEKEAIETRTVVNYNHSHALTILYYEVLRHFRVVNEVVRRRPAVLLRLKMDWFTGAEADNNVREHRSVLQAALLDASLVGAFDALERIEHRRRVGAVVGPPPAPPPHMAPGPPLRFFVFDMKTGGMFANEKGENIAISARLWPAGHKLNDGNQFSPPGAFTQENVNNSFVGLLPPGVATVQWGDIDIIEIDVDIFKGDETGTDVSFQHIKVTGIDVNGNEVVLIDKGYEDGHLILSNDASIWLPTRRPQPPPSPPGRPAEEIEDDVQRGRLLDHLAYHKEHYSRAILFGQSATDRASWLATLKLPDGSSIADRVENRPLEIVGEYVAFPCTDPGWTAEIERRLIEFPLADLIDERLVTLPTRGVFAEAKLGHCNASELIDNTCFWDWQQSPIPHLAPEIAPVQAVTPQPQQPNLQTTPFPQSLVNIVNPPAAPDPTGLAAAMNVLATPNIFRDMSGQAQVADLLKKLSDNSVSIAEASKMARNIQSQGGGGLTRGGAAASLGAAALGSAGFGARATPTQPSATTRDLQDLRNELKQGVQDGMLTDDQARPAYTNAVNRVAQGKPMMNLSFATGFDKVSTALPSDPLRPWWVTAPLPDRNDLAALIAEGEALIDARDAEYSSLYIPTSKATLAADIKHALEVNLFRLKTLSARMQKVLTMILAAAAGASDDEQAKALWEGERLDFAIAAINMNDYSIVAIKAVVFDPNATKKQLVTVPLNDRASADGDIYAAYTAANP